jgi:hypothetical protein
MRRPPWLGLLLVGDGAIDAHIWGLLAIPGWALTMMHALSTFVNQRIHDFRQNEKSFVQHLAAGASRPAVMGQYIDYKGLTRSSQERKVNGSDADAGDRSERKD